MKPNFVKRRGWRKPRGLHSKVRESKKGNIGLFKIGMSKGKSNVKKTKIVYNIKELKNEKEIIIADVGLKKKKKIIEEAEKLGIRIVNIRNPKEFLKKIEEKKSRERERKKEKEDKGKKVEKAEKGKIEEKLEDDKEG